MSLPANNTGGKSELIKTQRQEQPLLTHSLFQAVGKVVEGGTKWDYRDFQKAELLGTEQLLGCESVLSYSPFTGAFPHIMLWPNLMDMLCYWNYHSNGTVDSDTSNSDTPFRGPGLP